MNKKDKTESFTSGHGRKKTQKSSFVVRRIGAFFAVLAFVLAAFNPLHHAEAKARPATYLAEAMAIKEVPDSDEGQLAMFQRQEKLAEFLTSHYRRTNLTDMREIVKESYIAGEKYDIDPLLILAIIGVESSFNKKAVSKAGAQGLMQVMVKVHAKAFAPYGGRAASRDVKPNIQVGTQILADYLKKTGSIYKALKRYMGGANLAHDQGYGSKVMHLRKGLVDVADGKVDVAKSHLKKGSHENVAMTYFYDKPKTKTEITTG